MTGDKPNPLDEDVDFYIPAGDKFRVVLTFELQRNEKEAAEKWFLQHYKEKHDNNVDQKGCFVASVGYGYMFTRTSLVTCVCDFCGEKELVSEP